MASASIGRLVSKGGIEGRYRGAVSKGSVGKQYEKAVNKSFALKARGRGASEALIEREEKALTVTRILELAKVNILPLILIPMIFLGIRHT
jgi:hypothetical protein